MTPDAPATDAVFPLPPFARFGVVFGWGLRRGFRSKKFLATTLFAVLGGVGLGLLTAHVSKRPAFEFWETLDHAFLAIGLPLVALALVASGFGEEIQDQTLVYHLVRPVSRATVFLGRYAGGVVPGALVGAAMITAAMLASGLDLPPETIAAAALLAMLGVATVGALYYALTALFRRGLVAALVYTFVVEGFFQAIPGSTRKLSVLHHVRSIFHRWTDDTFARLSTDVAKAVEVTANPARPMLRGLTAAEEPWTSVPAALLVCAGVIVAALFLGSRAVSKRDFALKD